MYKSAMRSIFSSLAKENRVFLSDKINIENPKTKVFVDFLKKNELKEGLFIVDEISNNLDLASRNLPNVNVTNLNTLNPINLLKFNSQSYRRKIIMSTVIPNKIIESALVSEKSSLVGQNANTYVFKINTSATKYQVKKAVEEKFDVNVTKVNILNIKGKKKRMMNLKGKIRKKSNWKKAYVSLKPEQRIEIIQE